LATAGSGLREGVRSAGVGRARWPTGDLRMRMVSVGVGITSDSVLPLGGSRGPLLYEKLLGRLCALRVSRSPLLEQGLPWRAGCGRAT
jgi:hypothetical protein